MKIRRIYLENYHVFRDPQEILFSDGIIGILGPNGSGKSYLVESILFALFGYTRTRRLENVPSQGSKSPAIVEVEIEIGQLLYTFRRSCSITKGSSAEIKLNSQTIVHGSQNVRDYVRGLIGYDEFGFRSSIFAEQRQLQSLSDKTPSERRALVLKLLGVTPIEQAQEELSKDVRVKKEKLDLLRANIGDREGLKSQFDELRRIKAKKEEDLNLVTVQIHKTKRKLEDLRQVEMTIRDKERRKEFLSEKRGDLKESYERINVRLKRLRKEIEMNKQLLTSHLREEKLSCKNLAQLTAELKGLQARLEQATLEIEIATSKTEQLRVKMAEIRARIQHLHDDLERHEKLKTGDRCPTCNQRLSGDFELTVGREIATLKRLKSEITRYAKQYKTSETELSDQKKKVKEIVNSIDQLKDTIKQAERLEDLIVATRNEVIRAEESYKELESDRNRINVNTKNLDLEIKSLELTEDERTVLQDLVLTEIELERLSREKGNFEIEMAKLSERINFTSEQIIESQLRLEQVERLLTELSYGSKVKALLDEFKGVIVSELGPVLSRDASTLFAELTEGAYSGLDISSEDFSVKVSHDGRSLDLARFSGSERDLANLAYRIAISQNLAFASFQNNSLLVLDEVFSSLDFKRSQYLLQALNHIRNRFAQIFLVAHSEVIKDQISQVYEVERTGNYSRIKTG